MRFSTNKTVILLWVAVLSTILIAQNNCLKFDGIDDYVEFGTPSSLRLSSLVTVEAWRYPETYSIWPGNATNLQDNNTEESGYGLFLSTNYNWSFGTFSASTTFSGIYDWICNSEPNMISSISIDNIFINFLSNINVTEDLTSDNLFLNSNFNSINDITKINEKVFSRDIERLTVGEIKPIIFESASKVNKI